MKRLLWIGNYEDKCILPQMVKKGYLSSSSQVSQGNIISGMEISKNCTFDIISGSVLPPYPKYQDLFIKPHIWSHATGAEDLSVGYVNLKYYNRLSCQKSMVKAATNWANRNKDYHDEIIVMTYSMRSSVMAAACKVKDIVPSAKIVLIITDLPVYMDLAPSKVKRMLKKFDATQQNKYLEKFDGFVLYAELMAQYLKLQERPRIVMEGSISEDECKKAENTPLEKSNDLITVMYSGKVSMNYGIPELLDAFATIHDDRYRLWITGSGDAEDFVKRRANLDKRIHYFGFLESRDELIELQKKATMFVSMRMPMEDASKYCFPSKLFEYMITGKPVLSFEIGGIPDEYWDYLIKMDSVAPIDIAKAILEVGNMDISKRNEYGKAAKSFILDKKNNVTQANRIWNFVLEL